MFNYISNTILYFIAMTLPKLAGLILLPLYSLYITPADFGIYGYINTIVIFIAVLSSLALNAFYLRYYPLNEDKKEINGTIFWFMCLWNIFLLATGLTITYVFWDFAEVSFDYMPYMPIALVGQFFNSMEIIPMRTYRIRGEAKYYLYRVLAKCILTILFAYVFVVHFRLGALGRLYSDFLNALIFTVIFIIYMLRNSYLKINTALLRRALKFSLPIVPSDLLVTASPMCNAIVIEKLLPLSQLGIYSMGATIGSAVQMVTQSISLAIEPEYYLKAASPEFPEYARKLKNFLMVVVSLFCVAFGLVIREVIILFLSSKYAATWQVAQFLIVSYIVMVIQSVCTQLAIVQDRTYVLVWASLCSLLATIAANLVLLPLWGANVLGLSSAVGAVCSFVVLYFSVDRRGYEAMNYTRDFAVVAISAFAIFGSRYFNDLLIFYALIIKFIIFMLFVLILLKIYDIRFADLINSLRKILKRK